MNFVETVRNAGIIGAGGAGFPTYVKMQSNPDTLICNAAECEPLLYTDYYVIQNNIENIVRGILLAKAQLGAERAVFAIKEKRRDLFPPIKKAIREAGGGIELFALGDYYPAGDEQSLVHDVTGRIVPQNGIPIQVNVVVNNVLTLLQLCNAIENNIPVTERYVSVVGRVKHPYVAVVPIGTPFSKLTELAKPEPGTVLIEGGVMMGQVRTGEDTVTKTTGALVFLEEENPAVREKTASFQSVTRFSKSACCQCTECTVLCPRFNLGHDIEPHMIMRTLNYGLDASSAVAQAAYLCCQCGICSMFACPFGLSPKRVFADFRARLKEYTLPAKTHTPDPFNNAKKLPSKRLKARLNILDIDIKPEFIGPLPYSGPYKIRVKQHIGAPANPTVKTGDRITAGQILSNVKEDELGTPVHSPVSGVVKKITEEFITIGSES